MGRVLNRYCTQPVDKQKRQTESIVDRQLQKSDTIREIEIRVAKWSPEVI